MKDGTYEEKTDSHCSFPVPGGTGRPVPGVHTQSPGNARVINYTGVVRGATQRLVKEELKGRADDALIARLDGIMEELATGVGANRLIRLNDQAYQDLLASMEDQWQELKEEIMLVRQGKDSQTLFELSESYFQLADTTVTAAEQYTEQQVNRTSRGSGS